MHMNNIANESDVTSDRDHQNTLRNRLSSKRKQVYKVGQGTAEKESDMVERLINHRKNAPQPEKKAATVIKGSVINAHHG